MDAAVGSLPTKVPKICRRTTYDEFLVEMSTKHLFGYSQVKVYVEPESLRPGSTRNSSCLLLDHIYAHLDETAPHSEKKKRKLSCKGHPKRTKWSAGKMQCKSGTPHPKTLKTTKTVECHEAVEALEDYDLSDLDSETESASLESNPNESSAASDITVNRKNLSECSADDAETNEGDLEIQEEDSEQLEIELVEWNECDQMIVSLSNSHTPENTLERSLLNSSASDEDGRTSPQETVSDVEAERKLYAEPVGKTCADIPDTVLLDCEEFLKNCDKVVHRQPKPKYGVEIGWQVDSVDAVSLKGEPEFLVRYKQNSFGYIVVERVPSSILMMHCTHKILGDFQQVTQNFVMEESVEDYIIL